jgi:hypothetical protein
MGPGMPTIVEFSGSDGSTPEPAPTRQFSPMLIFAQNARARADARLVRNSGMTFAFFFADANQPDALAQGQVAADHRGFPDRHSHPVVNEQAAADDSSWFAASRVAPGPVAAVALVLGQHMARWAS